jgi:hypothetical protein
MGSTFPSLARMRRLWARLLDHSRWARSLVETVSGRHLPPWRLPAGRKRVPHVPSMLSSEESRLLAWAARERYTGEGVIVDGGPFLGGSTAALCVGLQENRRTSRKAGVVHSFDLFLNDNCFYDTYLEELGEDVPLGESFLPVYERLMSPYREFLCVHPGDLCTVPYAAGPIEILFVDVAKSWELNASIVSKFFRHLIPGKSLVIHQDYLHFYSYWLVITMWFFRDYFTYEGRVDEGYSALFAYTRKIPEDMLETDLRSLPVAQKRAAFENELARTTGWQRNEILIGSALMLLHDARDEEAVRDVIRRVPPDAFDHPINRLALKWIPPHLLPGASRPRAA